MKTIVNFPSIVAATVFALGSATVWAESGSRTGDAANFLDGSACPPDGGACFDARAQGDRLDAELAVVYDKDPNGAAHGCAPSVPWVKNMFVNLTVEQGKVRLPFTADYLNGIAGRARHDTGFCMLGATTEQVGVMIALVQYRVIPFFYGCDPDTVGSCPGFRIK